MQRLACWLGAAAGSYTVTRPYCAHRREVQQRCGQANITRQRQGSCACGLPRQHVIVAASIVTVSFNDDRHVVCSCGFNCSSGTRVLHTRHSVSLDAIQRQPMMTSDKGRLVKHNGSHPSAVNITIKWGITSRMASQCIYAHDTCMQPPTAFSSPRTQRVALPARHMPYPYRPMEVCCGPTTPPRVHPADGCITWRASGSRRMWCMHVPRSAGIVGPPSPAAG
jgi:hypothetical protein